MNIVQTYFNYSKPLVPLNKDKVLFLVLHHAAAESAPVEQIHKWHRDNAWSGIGYNEYIAKDGTVHICRGDNIGAHCANMNSKSYGICLEGNYNKESVMPIPQFKALVERLRYNKDRFPNLIEIAPHSKFYPSDCPGKYFNLSFVLQEVYQSKPSLSNDIDIIQRNVPITREYWEQCAVPGVECRGDYTGYLLHNIAEFMRKKGL